MTPSGPSPEFYIGYLPKAPEGIGRFAATATAVLVAGGLGLAIVLALSQAPFARAYFEFGIEREFQGRVHADPYPTVFLGRPGAGSSVGAGSSYLLTTFGKRGARPAVAAFDGSDVLLRGSLIYRDDHTMVELAEGSVGPVAGIGTGVPPVETYGEVRLVGEIVDSKCFLGVMNPGNLKPHRACAARCISGGVPPMLVVRGPAGETRHILLLSSDGGALGDEVIPFVAEPVEVRGRLERRGGLWYLRANPATYRRLS